MDNGAQDYGHNLAGPMWPQGDALLAPALEVRRTADGWAGRWEDRAERAEVVRAFGTEWLPLPFTPAASLADLVAFYGPGGSSMSAPVRVVAS